MSTTKDNSKYSYDRSVSIYKRNNRRMRDKNGTVSSRSVDLEYSREPTNDFGSSNLELVQMGKKIDNN